MKADRLYPILLAAITLFLSSCQSLEQADSNEGKALVMKAIDAHGGIKKWRDNGALHFRWKYNMRDKGVVVDSTQTIDPNTFEAVHTTPDKATTFGRNARGQYWISPPNASFTPPVSFWTLTPIYFLGIPFVFDDAQVNYELLPDKKTFQGKDYRQVQLTYNSTAGDSPDDLYVLLIDHQTNLVRGAYYTVTSPLVHKGGPLIKKFITLDNLQSINGLLLAGSHATYSMTDGVIGERIRSTEVSEVKFIDRENINFATPEGARIFTPVKR